MTSSSQKSFLEKILNESIEDEIVVHDFTGISGGCIHNAIKAHTNQGDFFVKFNQLSDADMFYKEYLGLKILQHVNEIRLPFPIRSGTAENKSFLVTEFLGSGPRKADFWEKFGHNLAKLHQHHHKQYGLDHDNYIGRLPQKNDYADSWIEFFTHQRLEKQVRLAVDQHIIGQDYANRFRRFFKLLPVLLPEEPPSLLHGDLWNGNFMTGPDGYAALIDPAVYFGNREIELSFTQMFGGFDREFYRSYDNQYPLEKGFDKRVDIYNLYPYLVHVNMFGRSYLSGVDRVLNYYV